MNKNAIDRGIVVAADRAQEWLLFWWWQNYRHNNSLPVAFVDLGMSSAAKEWCRSHGLYIPLSIEPTLRRVDRSRAVQWEAKFGNSIWNHRSAWFKKPLACLASPFEQTLWLDLDCQVISPVEPIFSYLTTPTTVALRKELFEPNVYNGGVICFKKENPLIEQWAILSVDENHLFAGDQDALSYLIQQKKHSIAELPESYNCSAYLPDTSHAHILHWHGPFGKECIQKQIEAKILPLYN